ncbi:MAG: glutamate formimidoyltransferase [Anaerolineae bacterium]
MPKIVECVPNFSEGRRQPVINRVVTAMEQVAGAQVLDVQSDSDHNRSVVTLVGDPQAVTEAAFQGTAEAARLIDMNHHRGEHPRMGAMDVIPFVPVRDLSIEDCAELARQLGKRIGTELNIPVYLYENAASQPARRNLADVRRGEYEGLKEEMGTDPERTPDFGPAVMGTAGATAVGARPPLIAFNVYLNTDDPEPAQAIARALRHSSGGLRFVKALGLVAGGQTQVSMNLTDFRRTPIYRVMEMIRSEAARYGLSITHSEIVGLLPAEALLDAARFYLQLSGFSSDQVLENRLMAPE